MSRFGKTKAGVKELAVLASVCLLIVIVIVVTCGCDARFKVGDEVGVPPLPASDYIIGAFDKILSTDLTENRYRLKDTPTSGVNEPVGLTYGGQYRVFFLYDGAIRMGSLQPASPYIDTGADGVADSGLGIGDFQINPVGADGLTDADVVVAPGDDSILDTLTPREEYSDDEIVDAVVPGINQTLDTTCNASDVVSNDGNYCLPGADDILNSVPVAGSDDKKSYVILAGPDGVAESGLAEDDLQGIPVVTASTSGYVSRIGISKNHGESNRLAVSPGSGGLKTVCVNDDNTRYNDINTQIIRINQTDGIYSGINGIVQSGLGGDDEQVVRAGVAIEPGGIIVRGGDDQLLQTIPIRDYDVQLITPNASAAEAADLILSPGASGVVMTCPEGDDYVVEKFINSGSNNIVESFAAGDDIQLLPYGETIPTNGAVIGAGPNGVLDSATGGDDQENVITGIGIAAGKNKIAETRVISGDDEAAIIDGRNLVAETGIGGDDVQVLSAGMVSQMVPVPVVAAGDNGILETEILGDEVEMVYNIAWPIGGTAKTAVDPTTDDVQVVPVGSTTLRTVGPSTIVFPVILPGPNGVIDTVVVSDDSLVIGDYGFDFETFRMLVVTFYGDNGIGTYQNPYGNSKLESGLGGRGALDIMVKCATVLDNGLAWPNDPYTGAPDYSVCIAREGTCPDDCQIVRSGEDVASSDPVIVDSGSNGIIDTTVLGDDVEAIIDGGNELAESGLGKNDTQLIRAGMGTPNATEIIAARDNTTGMERVLATFPAGDDILVNPGVDNLSGEESFEFDNIYTLTDPDGDKRVENFANVDDGEYFSWEDTNVDNILIPTSSANVPFDLGVSRSVYTYNIIKDDGNSDLLMMYLSNGMNIYLLTSEDGIIWSPPELVLEPGSNSKETDPVVLAGIDGVCNTEAEGDDVQAIETGNGLSNSVAIFTGRDNVFQSTVGGDDVRDGLFIRTGENGINESDVAGDDWLVIPKGQGQPDTACVLAGPNGVRNTSDGMIALSDDRPPFVDLDGDSGTNWLPDANEPSVTQNGSSGFDALAVSSPYVFKKDGKLYMFYSGWGALKEPEAQRPDAEAEAKFGPCMRPGMDWQMNNAHLDYAVNYDNTPGVVVAPRIGMAVSNDGIHWKKHGDPIVALGNFCSGLTDLSIINAIIDVSTLGLDLSLTSSPDFDYLGAVAPRVRTDKAANNEPVYSMIYTGINFARPYDPSGGALSGIMALMVDSDTKREQYAGTKTGIGLARSFTLTDDWEKIKTNNPVFSGSLFYEPISEQSPTLEEVGKGYFAYFGELNGGNSGTPSDDDDYISLATRNGTVYSLCMTIKSAAGTTSAQAAFGFFLIMLPALILVVRKAINKAK